MDFNSFLTYISKLKEIPLGGLDSQFKMAPELRKKFSEIEIEKRKPKQSAVLALFYPDKENITNFLLMQRANYNGVHAAQVSFPGGKKDSKDINLLQTALRETEEEVGVSSNKIIVFKELTQTYIPPSNFIVTPYMGLVQKTPVFEINNEVEKLIEVNIKDLLDERSVSSKNLSTSYMQNINVPCFKLNNYIVWGATAMMLSEIKDILRRINL